MIVGARVDPPEQVLEEHDEATRPLQTCAFRLERGGGTPVLAARTVVENDARVPRQLTPIRVTRGRTLGSGPSGDRIPCPGR